MFSPVAKILHTIFKFLWFLESMTLDLTKFVGFGICQQPLWISVIEVNIHMKPFYGYPFHGRPKFDLI